MPAGYDSSGGLFLFGGSWLVVVLALVTGDWDSLVSSSRAQPRDLYCTCGNQRVCAEGKRCPGAASHASLSVLQ